MPDRLLKGSIKRSTEIDSLSWFQEVCFYRLMVTVDDYGCYFADPQMIKSDLFPTKEDLTKASVAEALDKLESVGLIQRYEVNGKTYLHLCTWENHQRVRNKTRHFPEPPQIAATLKVEMNMAPQIAADCGDTKSRDKHAAADCGELQQIAANCSSTGNDNKRAAADCGRLRPSRTRAESKNPRIQESKNPRIQKSESEYIAPAEATAIIQDHDRVISAAENAGFARNDATRKILIDLYALHGLDKMLSAIQECVKYGVSTIAYLEGVLKGGPKKQSHGKLLPAQQYEQRDYSGEDEEAMKRMIRMAEECRA